MRRPRPTILTPLIVVPIIVVMLVATRDRSLLLQLVLAVLIGLLVAAGLTWQGRRSAP